MIAGDIYASHFAVSVGMFVVILLAQLEMFKYVHFNDLSKPSLLCAMIDPHDCFCLYGFTPRYCLFTSKGALDKFRHRKSKVGPGGESTFTTTTTDSEADSEDGSTRKLSVSAEDGSTRKLSVSANDQLSAGM